MRKGRFAGLVRGASPERQEAGAPTRADGFVALAEQQGIAWFWETDAHGDLAYVSAEAAPLIRGDQESLLGVPSPNCCWSSTESSKAAAARPSAFTWNPASHFERLRSARTAAAP
jgi:hypothetical protein